MACGSKRARRKRNGREAVDRTLISLSLVARIFYAAAVLQSNVVLLDGPAINTQGTVLQL